MWPWQLKNVPKEITVWAKLVALSCILHGTLLSLFVLGYRNHITQAVLTINTARPIFFIAESRAQPVSTVSAPKNVSLAGQKPPIKKQEVPAAKVSALPTIKPALATTITSEQKKAPPKTVPTKTVQKKSAPQKPILAKQEIKGIVPPVVSKPEIKKEIVAAPAINKDAPKKIEEKKVQSSAQPIPAEPIYQPVAQQIAQKSADPSEYSDQTMPLEYYNLVQHIMSEWKAPYGMQGNPSCCIKAIVSKDGTIEDIIVQESSGFLMFDIAARSALLSTTMPEWTRGKSFVITFKQ